MTHFNGRRRVVVTGQGVVTPLGTGVDKFWAAMQRSDCGIREVQSFSTEDLYITIAGEVPDFDPRERLQSKQLLLADKFSQYAGCATHEAVLQSKLEYPIKDSDSYRSACIIGSGVGGLTTLEFSYKMLFKENKRATHPLTLLKAIGSSASAHVSIEYGIKGPTFGLVSACATATHSIGLTYRMIREGLVDVGLAGAAEASLNWGATRAWQAMRVLSPDGLWPFAKRRNGTVLAEGAGILMLEEYERAKDRGAPILAELLGYGMTADAADMVNPSIDGASTAMQQALDDGGLAATDIDYIMPTAPGPWSTTSTRPAPSSVCSATPPTMCPSPRPSRCTAIVLAPAAASKRSRPSRPSSRTMCRPRPASTSRIPSATWTTRRTPARAVRSITPCRTASPLAASTRFWSSARRRRKASAGLPWRAASAASGPGRRRLNLCSG